MPELDTIRGVAVLMVLVDHFLWWENGDNGHPSVFTRWLLHTALLGSRGVTLFFVLSGFLITGILLQSRTRTDFYRRFYVRRALRILPAYFLLLIVLAVLGRAPWSFLGLSALFCSNLTPLFGVPMAYGPLWSLAVEEHFYLLWPSAARLLSERGLMVLAIVVIVSTAIVRGLARGLLHVDPLAYTWFELDGLAMGAVLALLLRRPWMTRERLVRWAFAAAALGAVILVGGARFGTLTRNSVPGAVLGNTAVILAFVAAIALTLVIGTSRARRLVNWPVLKFYGRISYGLYLVHTLVFELVLEWLQRVKPEWAAIDGRLGPILIRFVLAGAAATIISVLSRRFFEEPFLKLKNRFESPAGLAGEAQPFTLSP
jgi:peptidoglycan/LPS O-acetylase OafA/YrhL